MSVRTRFAPSPTGYLHVGGLRTALYAFLFARKHGGKFLLRIEDTDQKRFVEGAMENLIDTLHWVGLDYDEGPGKDGPHGPYVQSQRNDKYETASRELLEKGQAYQCFCTPEELDEMRKRQESRHEAPMYDRRCLKLSKEEIREKLEAKTPYVIRQLIPEGMLIIDDHIRGKVRFDSKTIDDQVLVKSDGFPTYHLANVVDDHDMEITHVIRGEEWLPSTPKHIWLYQSFGWTPPEYAHIPLLLNPDRTKLSKRQGDVSVEEYIKKGYLKEAIINFIAFLGWHPGKGIEKEIYSLEELIEAFSLENVHKSGAIFNLEKLDWFNWQWRRRKFLEEVDCNPSRRTSLLLEQCNSYLDAGYEKNAELLSRALKTTEEKILQDPKKVNDYIQFYFEAPSFKPEIVYNEKMKVDAQTVKLVLPEAISALSQLRESDWSEENIKSVLIGVVAKLAVKNGQVFWPVRAILTGEQFSPGVFEVVWALGKGETLRRLSFANQ
jgi:glutamyl-tRNA synthetase